MTIISATLGVAKRAIGKAVGVNPFRKAKPAVPNLGNITLTEPPKRDVVEFLTSQAIFNRGFFTVGRAEAVIKLLLSGDKMSRKKAAVLIRKMLKNKFNKGFSEADLLALENKKRHSRATAMAALKKLIASKNVSTAYVQKIVNSLLKSAPDEAKIGIFNFIAPYKQVSDIIMIVQSRLKNKDLMRLNRSINKLKAEEIEADIVLKRLKAKEVPESQIGPLQSAIMEQTAKKHAASDGIKRKETELDEALISIRNRVAQIEKRVAALRNKSSKYSEEQIEKMSYPQLRDWYKTFVKHDNRTLLAVIKQCSEQKYLLLKTHPELFGA